MASISIDIVVLMMCMVVAAGIRNAFPVSKRVRINRIARGTNHPIVFGWPSFAVEFLDLFGVREVEIDACPVSLFLPEHQLPGIQAFHGWIFEYILGLFCGFCFGGVSSP